MKHICYFFMMLSMLGVSLPVIAQEPLDTGTLTASEFKTLAIKPFLKIWHPDQPVSLNQAVAPENPARYQPVGVKLPLGSEIWLRLKIDVPKTASGAYMLTFNDPLANELDVHYLREGQWESVETGSTRPYKTRAVDHRLFSFPLFLAKGQENTIYFRMLLQGRRSEVFAAELNSMATYGPRLEQTSMTYLFPIILVSGFCLFMVVLYLLGFRTNAHIAYVVLIIDLCLMELFYNGNLLVFFLDKPSLHIQLGVIINAVMGVASLWLLYVLFDLEKTMPRLKRFTIGLIIANFIIVPLQLIFESQIIAAMAMLKSLLVMSCMLMIVIWAAILRLRSSLFILFVVFCYMAIILLDLSELLVSENSFLRVAMDNSLIVLGLLFGVALLKRVADVQSREAAMERKTIAAEASNLTKSAFLATMSHEIRTPLNGIMGMAQILKKMVKGSEERHYTEVLLNATRSLLVVLNDILDLSKIEAGKLQLEISNLNLGRLIVHLNAQCENSKRESPVKFKTNIEGDIPSDVLGDQTRLQQVINNLLSNAFKFTETGCVTLKIQHLPDPDDKHVRMRFSVKDTGIGINEETQNRLFSAYEQADSSVTREYGGTGLGLAICKQLVEIMGGEIGLNSAVGKGSEFWFVLDFNVDTQQREESERRRKILKGKKLALLFKFGFHVKSFSNHFSSIGMEVNELDINDKNLALAIKESDVVLTSTLQEASFDSLFTVCEKFDLPAVVVKVDGREVSSDQWPLARILCVDELLGITGMEEGFLSVLTGENISEPVSDNKTFAGSVAGLRVLIAEDNPVNCQVIKAMLKSVELMPTLVENGALALKEYQDNHSRYDMILMDCEMPVMDGYQATEKIRTFEKDNAIPPIFIYALTAHALEENKQRCLSAGMDRVLVKPIDFDSLLETLSQVKEQLDN